jgi:hypothetical protein
MAIANLINGRCRCRALTSVALFDLRSNGGIGGLKRRLQPRGAASGDAKEREQDEENAYCSPIVGHCSPIRVSQIAAGKRSDYATISAKINWPLQVAGSRRCSCRPGRSGARWQASGTVRREIGAKRKGRPQNDSGVYRPDAARFGSSGGRYHISADR